MRCRTKYFAPSLLQHPPAYTMSDKELLAQIAQVAGKSIIPQAGSQPSFLKQDRNAGRALRLIGMLFNRRHQ